jgi:hypothetical protein
MFFTGPAVFIGKQDVGRLQIRELFEIENLAPNFFEEDLAF